MISFESTEIAFKLKSDKDLQRAHMMFSSISKPYVMNISKFMLRLALKLHLPVGWIIKPTIYVHFTGGETIEECQGTVDQLATMNVKSILDYSVEGGDTIAGIERAMEETKKSILNAARSTEIPFAVFKPTAFVHSRVLEKSGSLTVTDEIEFNEVQQFRERIGELCRFAFEHHVPVLIDAEESWYQPLIDSIVTENMELFNKKEAIVFNTYQMYCKDRLEALREAYEKARTGNYYLGAKFVRGAYMEKERLRARTMGYDDPIHPDKDSTDKAFNDALVFSVQHIDRISIFNGTHNEYSSGLLAQLVHEYGLQNHDRRIYFSQLYGMSDHISFNLAHLGYNVAKYIPYGPVRNVMPYLIRRMEENSSIAGQTSRELRLIKEERKRRRG